MKTVMKWFGYDLELDTAIPVGKIAMHPETLKELTQKARTPGTACYEKGCVLQFGHMGEHQTIASLRA